MLILASKSPTRKTLLENAGLGFSVVPARVDERAIEARIARAGGTKRDIALALATEKALAVSKAHPEAVVIGADQTLEAQGLDVHTPKTRAMAARQLRALAGRAHALHAAAALAVGGASVWQGIDTAHLTMRAFTDTELETVLDLEGTAIFSSVGGYRLEGPSIRLFETVSGDYFTVLGVPLLALLDALAQNAPQTLQSENPALS